MPSKTLSRRLGFDEIWNRIVQFTSGRRNRLPNEPDAVALEGLLAPRRKPGPEKSADGFLILTYGCGLHALRDSQERAHTVCALYEYILELR